MSKKKITKVTDPVTKEMPKDSFKPTAENKSKATTNRVIALVLWAIAIGLEVFAILQLKKVPINMVLIIGLVVAIAILAIIGSVLWKKANRLDPASEKDKVKFFIQNQLGAIIAAIAFLPLLVLTLTNKNMDKQQKGIVSAVAVVALAVSMYAGFDFNPVSVEQYTEESARVSELMGTELVYWTKSGSKYHLFDDCHTINSNRTDEIFEGTVPQAYEIKSIHELCKICENRAIKLNEEVDA